MANDTTIDLKAELERLRAEIAQDPGYYERIREEIKNDPERFGIIRKRIALEPGYIDSLSHGDLEKLAAVQVALTRFFESEAGQRMQDNARKYNLLRAEVMQKYNLTEEQLAEIMAANAKELTDLEFNDFVAGSITEDEHLAVNGLLDAIVKRAREEGRPVSEIIKETAEAVDKGDTLKEENLLQLIGGGTPKNYTSPNSTLTNALQALDGKGELFGRGKTAIPVLNVGKDSEISIYVNATAENMVKGKLENGKPWTEYDRAVYDSICSLYIDREKNNLPAVATSEMIYRIMTHKTQSENVGRAAIAAVTKSIDKHRRELYLSLDATDEIRARKVSIDGKPVESLDIEDYLLSARKITVKSGGKTKSAYVFKEPILLSYAKLNGQLFTAQGKYLDIKEVDKNGNPTPVSLANTDTRIAVKSYLLRRIKVMKRDEDLARDALRKYQARKKKNPEQPEKALDDFRAQQRTILFDSIFEAAEITDRTAPRMKEYVYNVLDYWKAVTPPLITDYKKRKRGKAVDAVEINI